MSAWIRRAALGALTLALAFPALAEQPVRVFAAASLTNALNDIATEWERAGHAKPSLAFAASSALARQIEAGAPADVFASADLTWMDYLDQRGKPLLGVRVHGAELPDPEGLALDPHPSLAEEDRPMITDLDRDRDGDEDR